MSENDLPVAPVQNIAHTPGPWAARRGEHGWGIEYSSRHGICTIHDNTDGSRRDEQAANARLIAKSPELLNFVESFVYEWEATWIDPDDVNHEWSDLYRLAKELIRDVNGGHSV